MPISTSSTCTFPATRRTFPVLVFLHGGSWRSGDRSLYKALGDRLARAGIGVAIPSYRLMPQNPHPAQIEDVAAAFAWVVRNIAQHGGDPSRIYLSGHSAGSPSGGAARPGRKIPEKVRSDSQSDSRRHRHERHLRRRASSTRSWWRRIKGGKHDASPIAHAHSGAPHFLITYCQWDYFGLPKQARDFTLALKRNFVPAELLYVPGENHISEVISLVAGSRTADRYHPERDQQSSDDARLRSGRCGPQRHRHASAGSEIPASTAARSPSSARS